MSLSSANRSRYPAKGSYSHSAHSHDTMYGTMWTVVEPSGQVRVMFLFWTASGLQQWQLVCVERKECQQWLVYTSVSLFQAKKVLRYLIVGSLIANLAVAIFKRKHKPAQTAVVTSEWRSTHTVLDKLWVQYHSGSHIHRVEEMSKSLLGCRSVLVPCQLHVKDISSSMAAGHNSLGSISYITRFLTFSSSLEKKNRNWFATTLFLI